jgi:hypothetical protein
MKKKGKSVKRASKLKRGRPVVLQRFVRRPDRELELYEMRRYMI